MFKFAILTQPPVTLRLDGNTSSISQNTWTDDCVELRIQEFPEGMS